MKKGHLQEVQIVKQETAETLNKDNTKSRSYKNWIKKNAQNTKYEIQKYKILLQKKNKPNTEILSPSKKYHKIQKCKCNDYTTQKILKKINPKYREKKRKRKICGQSFAVLGFFLDNDHTTNILLTNIKIFNLIIYT